jgi:hypothetical protein
MPWWRPSRVSTAFFRDASFAARNTSHVREFFDRGVGSAPAVVGRDTAMKETPKVTPASSWQRSSFKRVPSCSDIRAEYVQIMHLKPKGLGPNWFATIDLPMSTLAKMEAKAVIDGVRGRYALKQG